MKPLETMLRKELRELELIVKRANERIRTAPGGGLQIKKKGDTIEYYYREVGANLSNGRYLKKSERGIVKRIVQRDYDMKIVRYAEESASGRNLKK